MATASPVPRLPAEPIPPSPESSPRSSLGLENVPEWAPAGGLDHGASFLSPLRDEFRLHPDSPRKLPNGHANTGGGRFLGSSAASTASPGLADDLSTVTNPASAFNFQPATLSKSPISKSGVGQRRGHKYKHSSISHSIFLEPAPKPPLTLPTSLPIPTVHEVFHSRSQQQSLRFIWCLCHAAVAAYTLWSSEGSLALTALSHLLAFDALGAMLCAVLDVLANFDAWARPSIRHPFGLERVEVLAGFAMSVLLLFMGLDLISHNLQHGLEHMGSHEPHIAHAHDVHTGGSHRNSLDLDPKAGVEVDTDGMRPHVHRIGAGELDTAALLAVAATLVSALALNNHARIGRAMRLPYFQRLPSILSNPAHFLTLACSSLLLLLPLLAVETSRRFDQVLSTAAALSMCALGTRLVHRLGLMLLMSCPPAPSPPTSTHNSPRPPSISSFDPSSLTSIASTTGPTSKHATERLASLVAALESDPAVSAVDALRVWQVHYGLCMACVSIRTHRRSGMSTTSTALSGPGHVGLTNNTMPMSAGPHGMSHAVNPNSNSVTIEPIAGGLQHHVGAGGLGSDGASDAVAKNARLRDLVATLVRSRLRGGFGQAGTGAGVRWEVSVAIHEDGVAD